jgi:flagellar motor protein MotB
MAELSARPRPARAAAAAAVPAHGDRKQEVCSVLKHVWLILLGLLVAGCGYSEEEWQAQLDKYSTLNRQYEQEKAAHAATRAELEKTQQKVLRLSNQLKQMGVDMDALAQQLEAEGTEKAKLANSLQELRRALEEYKARAAQLERIKNRFEALKAKLKKLTDLGLKVEIRNNRMVILLPGDVLFASGSTKIEDKGKQVILAVAEVIRKDPDLAKRYYQIAGHTDDKPFNNFALKDNWGPQRAHLHDRASRRQGRRRRARSEPPARSRLWQHRSGGQGRHRRGPSAEPPSGAGGDARRVRNARSAESVARSVCPSGPPP